MDNKQLALWDNLESMSGKKPIPQDIARAFGFDLQRVEQDGNVYYSIHDWIRGVCQSDNPSRYWSDMRRRTQGNQSDSYARCVTLPYTTTNGKTRQMDYADDELIYFITQRMESTPRVIQVLLLFSKYLKQASDHRQNPERAKEYWRQRYIADKVAQGLSEDQAVKALRIREDAKDDFKRLADVVFQICSDTPRMDAIINAEYVALFGAVAKELKVLLNAKNIRDALPELQLSYLHTAETGLRAVLERKDALSNERIVYAARQVCAPLGEHLQSLCSILGINRVTSQPVLGQE